MLFTYVLSRWFSWHAGIAFDSSTLTHFWQYLDPELLRDDLLRSLWYLHAQPPAFNAFLGVTTKVCPVPADCFLWIYRAFGLVLHLALYVLLRRMGVPTTGAAVVAGLFAFTPASMLYEHWLFYSYPVATLITVAVACAGWAASRPSIGRIALFFFLVSLAALARSVLHLVWLFGCLGILLVLLPAARQRILIGALPLFLVVGWYAKNQFLFDTFQPSSWLGLSVARLAVVPGTREQKEAWQRAGASPLATRLPFNTPVNRFPMACRDPARGPSARHPALDAERKSTGYRNFNHRAYLGLSEQYLADAKVALTLNPEVYLKSVCRAWLIYLLPPSQYSFLNSNRERIRGLDRWVNGWVYGAPAHLASSKPKRQDLHSIPYLVQHASWLWAMLLLLGIVHAAAIHRSRAHDKDRAVAHAIAAFTVVYLAIVGNLLEVTENNRFRMMTEPLSLALIVSATATGVRRTRTRPLRQETVAPEDLSEMTFEFRKSKPLR